MVDAIVYRHKLNLKNNIEGYQWINEKFAKLLNLFATEVTAYKKELTLNNIKCRYIVTTDSSNGGNGREQEKISQDMPNGRLW